MHHGGGGGAGHGHGGHHGGHGAHHSSHHHHGGAPSSSASWNMAMQADSFWVNMLKANSKPLIVVFGVIGAMFGWLCLLHYLHVKDNPDHVVSNSVWNQQLTSVNPHEAPVQSFSQPAQGADGSAAPEAFGAPRCADEAQSADAAPMNNRTYSNRTTPSLAPLMFSHFMPGGYQPQSSAAPSFSAATFSAPAPNAAPGFAMPQQLMPTRVHSAERYRMVVSR